jgi:hypothetical protein
MQQLLKHQYCVINEVKQHRMRSVFGWVALVSYESIPAWMLCKNFITCRNICINKCGLDAVPSFICLFV